MFLCFPKPILDSLSDIFPFDGKIYQKSFSNLLSAILISQNLFTFLN